MSHLYINNQANPVTIHSYSSGETFRDCAYRYFLDKVKGWKRKDKSAALNFGKAIESAVQFYHENNLRPDSGIDEFKRIWLAYKDNQELRYSTKEGSWAALYQGGAEMLRLYEIVLPTLPIKDPVWQANVKKKVFPGTTLDDIEDQGFLDMISKAPWVHPLLPKVDIPVGAAHRPLVIDLKTAGLAISATPQMLTLDPQLRRYGWLSGIKDVGFLTFIKANPTSFQKGTEVTLLEPSGKWTAGTELVVHEFDTETQTALVAHPQVLHGMKEALDAIKGKGSKEKKEQQTAVWLAEGILVSVPAGHITKQRIQFVAVRLADEDLIETGEGVAKDIVEIVEAGRTGKYLKNPGVRFPNNRCGMCSWRGICLKDDALRDNLLVQITTPEADWIDEIEEEEG